MKIIKSTQLKKWFYYNSRKTQSIFPELIRKLIRMSINRTSNIHLPSGDSIYTTGWDAIVKHNEVKHEFVPLGSSFWELGTNNNSVAKIEADYKKRKAQSTIYDKSQYTYVAVTSRILDSGKKEEICEQIKKDKNFKDAIIIDANDLECWLEGHIDITIWLLNKYEESIKDYEINTVENIWQEISQSTNPKLTETIFTTGNQAQATRFIDDITNNLVTGNNYYAVCSPFYGQEHALFFAVASIISSNNEALIERSIVVESQAGLDIINAFCEDKIIILNFNCFDKRLSKNTTNKYIFLENITAGIQLELVSQQDFTKAIETLGYSAGEAYRISYTVENNAVALRRLLAQVPTLKKPRWAREKNKNDLIPLMILGEINMNKLSDIEMLKAIVGDNYDQYLETLNFWTEIGYAPLYKYEDVYRICSKKECFENIQVDHFSVKIKKIEDKIKELFCNKDIDNNLFNERTIRNIIEAFIIMAQQSERNQLHFDFYVEEIFKNVSGNEVLYERIKTFLSLLAELSPQKFIKYIEGEIANDNPVFNALVNKESSVNSCDFVNYISYGLDRSLRLKETVVKSLKVLLQLYYHVNENLLLLERIQESFSPITVGLFPISLHRKTELLFNYIKDQDSNKTKKIMEGLSSGGKLNMMIASARSYRQFDEQEKIHYTYQDYFDLQSQAIKWLINNSSQSDLASLLEKALNNIYYRPKNLLCEDLEQIKQKCLTDNVSDEVKAELNVKVLSKIEDLKKFDRKYKNDYLPILQEFLDAIAPTDTYISYRYMFTQDNFPLANPIKFESNANWYERDNESREILRKNAIEVLLKEYGENILERIINDATKKSYSIWKLLFCYSKDKEKDIIQMIKLKEQVGLSFYLSRIENAVLVKYIDIAENEEDAFIFSCLPFNIQTINFVSGKTNEKLYWEGRRLYFNDELSFEQVFDKMLKFYPTGLLDYFAYRRDYSYEEGILLLNALATYLQEENNEIRRLDFYSLKEIIKKMDNKYYTKELSKCEFDLLEYILTDLEDYPLGIKKYFWDNPKELGGLLSELYNKRDKLQQGSLGAKIFFEAHISLGEKSFIPKEYMLQYKEKLYSWAMEIINVNSIDNKNLKIFLKLAVINTLAKCPKEINAKIWPIKEVADILEELSKEDFDSPERVSSNFYCSFFNTRGMRTIGNGEEEFVLNEEYLAYKDYYDVSHPVVATALGYIANGYKEEGEMDKRWYLFGEY
nr:hypothetical protein [Clostridia bacterium]